MSGLRIALSALLLLLSAGQVSAVLQDSRVVGALAEAVTVCDTELAQIGSTRGRPQSSASVAEALQKIRALAEQVRVLVPRAAVRSKLDTLDQRIDFELMRLVRVSGPASLYPAPTAVWLMHHLRTHLLEIAREAQASR
jgi:hypothetical protein